MAHCKWEQQQPGQRNDPEPDHVRDVWQEIETKEQVSQRLEAQGEEAAALEGNRGRALAGDHWRPSWGKGVLGLKGGEIYSFCTLMEISQEREGQLEAQEEEMKARQRQAGLSVKRLELLGGAAGSMDARAKVHFLLAPVSSMTLGCIVAWSEDGK